MKVLLIIPFLISNIFSLKLSFGSCADFRKYDDNGIFHSVAKLQPDYWIWLGDVAYLGSRISKGVHRYQGRVEAIRRLSLTKENPGYKKVRSSVKEIFGVWDDHDYGMRDGNKYFEKKEETKQLFLQFLDEKPDSPRWKADSLYFTRDFTSNSVTFKLIMLDGRTHSDGENDLLGETQWRQLENDLQDKNVSFFIISSGIQILPDDRFAHEMWPEYSKNRLFNLLKGKNGNLKTVLFITGDIHMGEILTCPEYENLYEITSSGLNFHRGITHTFAPFLTEISVPDSFSTPKKRFIGSNFAFLNINGFLIEASIYDNKGNLRIFRRINLSKTITKTDFELSSPYSRAIFEFIRKMIFEFTIITILTLLAAIFLVFIAYKLVFRLKSILNKLKEN